MRTAVRQGCAMLCTEGLTINGKVVNNIRVADDTDYNNLRWRLVNRNSKCCEHYELERKYMWEQNQYLQWT